VAFEIGLGQGTPHAVEVSRHGDEATVFVDGRSHRCSLRLMGDAHQLRVDDRVEPVWLALQGDTVFAHAFGRSWQLTVVDPVERERRGAEQADVATAPMPGTVVTVAVEAGDAVALGQPLVVIESMKMQSEIVATRDGVVDRVLLQVGDTFDRGAGLVALVPEQED